MLGIGGALRIQKDKTKNKLGKNNNAKRPQFGGMGTPAQGASYAPSLGMNAGLVSTVALSHT